MLPTMALFFILAMWEHMMMSLLPVAVTKMSISDTTDSMVTTRKPSMHACRAQMGSASATYTTQPAALRAWAQPLPTSPKPAMKARLPASMTSVARMIPSGRECLQPYRLSNLDLVTESLTLMAGKSSSPDFSMSYRRWTPVVVSSDTPLHRAASLCHLSGSESRVRRMMPYTSFSSGFSVVAGSGLEPSTLKTFSALKPSWMSRVASPPSSTMMSRFSPFQLSILSVHHQYSSRVSPFQANTAAESRATAAAAWSWVEKMLQEHQRTLAPRAARVSMSTAVWMVMCREPEMLAPARGCAAPNSVIMDMSPGISTCASSISMRPKSAWAMSLTLYSRPLTVSMTHMAEGALIFADEWGALGG
mmetsp:Transcript_29505/g.73063  ORF Transcript_29505/g.73063 Transcript_29505/m.73063 type:complete len:362 (+) Transcript_29505:873-1958(+)